MVRADPQLAVDPRVRELLCVAIDSDDLVDAERLVRNLSPYFGTVKVGPVLWAAAGPEAVGAFSDLGCDVFVDLKLHDTPEIVFRTARVLASLGVSYVTMHARGGLEMLTAGIAGLAEGAYNAGVVPPAALAVTVLTSDAEAPDHLIPQRLRVAMEGGCDGVVCAVRDLADVASMAPRMLRVTTGIRTTDSPGSSEVTATPLAARQAGSDLIIIGRAVTGAEDPEIVAVAIASELDPDSDADSGANE